MDYKILGARWLTCMTGVIGVVAFESYKDEWMAVMGATDGTHSTEYDIQRIAGYGAKLFPREAHAFFPELDITKYKNYASMAEAVR